MNKISPELRMPLSPMSQSNLEKLKKVMEKYKLL
jgi:hypothetical protein